MREATFRALTATSTPPRRVAPYPELSANRGARQAVPRRDRRGVLLAVNGPVRHAELVRERRPGQSREVFAPPPCPLAFGRTRRWRIGRGGLAQSWLRGCPRVPRGVDDTCRRGRSFQSVPLDRGGRISRSLAVCAGEKLPNPRPPVAAGRVIEEIVVTHPESAIQIRDRGIGVPQGVELSLFQPNDASVEPVLRHFNGPNKTLRLRRE
jgi:hypothetical protein